MIKVVYLYIEGIFFFSHIFNLILYFHYRISESWELKYGFALLNFFFFSEWCYALQIIIMLLRNNCGINMEFIQILILNIVQYFIFRI